MKVSVIIPAYNAEQYLIETLESVVNQSISDYEVIVVNDGSTDSTLDILKTYAKEYPHLQVIDKENGGVSAARNVALDMARGEYVYFFDADDLLEPDALACLYNRAKEQDAELVIAGYDIFDAYKTTKVKDLDELLLEDQIDCYDETILWTFSLWNKLFKKSVIDANGFRFPPISYSEDGVFVMQYVHHAKRITGLDKIILHYRRMNGTGNAITEHISDSKVKDYIKAHQLILENTQKNILRDFPQYTSIEEVWRKDTRLTEYLYRIIHKELNILLRQFYTKFWLLAEDTIALIVAEIQDRLKQLDLKTVSLLADDNPDIVLSRLCVRKADMVNEAHFTAVLYDDGSQQSAFLNCINSIVRQNLIGIRIVVPECMRAAIEDAGMLYENIVFLEADSEDALFCAALKTADTQYIVFCDPQIIYANNAFKYVFKRFIKSNKDFLIELVHHNDYGEAQPITVNRMAMASVAKDIRWNPDLCMDRLLANKFFTVDFLRDSGLVLEKSILPQLERLYKIGAYTFFADGVVLYTDAEESFLDFIATAESRPYILERLRDKPADLNGADLKPDPAEAFVKLLDLEPETRQDKWMYRAIAHYSKKKIKDQTLFISVRKDGELEGNAKALYPHVRGKKVICAKRLPHDTLTILRMIKHLATSKVIVTDDYMKYLRYFPLRPSQRVIQLWHACGVFKKFGQRGTNLTVGTDMATHAQYNLACVSGDSIRSIYADAFNIPLRRVKALGVPRTDDFFNQSLIEQKKQAIYAKYPELKDKFIIVYAPTFRDVGAGRSEFHPKLDFDQLSKNLLPNQQFIICPHPVMKNDILPKSYPNIKVMRDFSTNDFMFVSDMLITDYSSVIFEYALLKKPIAFFCYDLAAYNRGFYLKYPEDLPGDVYETQEALEAYLTNPKEQVLTEKYERFTEKYMSACDGQSCARIAALINAYVGGEK